MKKALQQMPQSPVGCIAQNSGSTTLETDRICKLHYKLPIRILGLYFKLSNAANTSTLLQKVIFQMQCNGQQTGHRYSLGLKLQTRMDDRL